MSKTNSEIAHIWAQGRHIAARTGNGNFSCSCNILYSYRTIVGKFYDDIAVYTNYSYSVTTKGKHIAKLYNALKNKEHYATAREIRDLPDDFNSFLELWLSDELTKIQEIIDSLGRKRKLDGYISRVQYLAEEANKMLKKHGNKLTYPDHVIDNETLDSLALHNKTVETIDAMLPTIKARLAAQRAQAQAEKLARAEKTRERRYRASIELDKWIRHEKSSNVLFHELPIKLRANNDDGIETSRGAIVPITQAVELYAAIKSGIDVTGQKIGYFAVEELNSKSIKIGCHTILLSEFDRLADELGLSK